MGERRNLRLVVEYDGSRYHGSQAQAPGLRTIQSVLDEALRVTFDEPVKSIFASRTDAGVHALGQVVNVRTSSRIPVERLPLALATRLPDDIAVTEASEASPAFHARFDATGKAYAYAIWRRATTHPFWVARSWHVPQRLDVEAMAAAGRQWLGRQPFDSFASVHRSVKTTTRELRRIELEAAEQVLWLHFEADGFLYNMVRIMVGTLVEMGLGRRAAGDAAAILAARDRRCAGRTAPARGLHLLRVEYGG
ncbi:MAG TPA: tRNA pseudouridine(38-40) synthase TruA [Limnochordia bacterium]|nr:tRNA pseudouridine(38-40) synthase TruA [Limnochordia bacterium]